MYHHKCRENSVRFSPYNGLMSGDTRFHVAGGYFTEVDAKACACSIFACTAICVGRCGLDDVFLYFSPMGACLLHIIGCILSMRLEYSFKKEMQQDA
jgi:hypothetical protein